MPERKETKQMQNKQAGHKSSSFYCYGLYSNSFYVVLAAIAVISQYSPETISLAPNPYHHLYHHHHHLPDPALILIESAPVSPPFFNYQRARKSLLEETRIPNQTAGSNSTLITGRDSASLYLVMGYPARICQNNQESLLQIPYSE